MQAICASTSHTLAPEHLKRLAAAEIDSLYRLALHLSRDPEEAGDLVQEPFARALRPDVRFKLGARGIRPWLFKILHNLFLSSAAAKTLARRRFVDADSLHLHPFRDPRSGSIEHRR